MNYASVRDHRVQTARELLSLIDPLRDDHPPGTLYRGHAKARWTLTPSSWRHRLEESTADGTWDVSSEKWGDFDLIERAACEFRIEADRVGMPIDAEAQMAVAQHYGLPTCLLDWTGNPYVAAYFAASDSLFLRSDDDMAIYTTAKQNHVFRSIRMVQDSTGELKEAPHIYTLELGFISVPLSPNPNMRAQKGELMQVKLAYNSAEFINASNAYPATWNEFFRLNGDVQPDSPLWENRPIVPLLSHYPHFLPISLEGMLDTIADQLVEEEKAVALSLLKKVVLPASENVKLLELLDRLGYNGATIFPGLTGVARLVRERSLRSR